LTPLGPGGPPPLRHEFSPSQMDRARTGAANAVWGERTDDRKSWPPSYPNRESRPALRLARPPPVDVGLPLCAQTDAPRRENIRRFLGFFFVSTDFVPIRPVCPGPDALVAPPEGRHERKRLYSDGPRWETDYRRTLVLTKLTIVSVGVCTLWTFRTWSATLAISSSSEPALPCQRQAWSASLHLNSGTTTPLWLV